MTNFTKSENRISLYNKEYKATKPNAWSDLHKANLTRSMPIVLIRLQKIFGVIETKK
jgi:hypothetical protein